MREEDYFKNVIFRDVFVREGVDIVNACDKVKPDIRNWRFCAYIRGRVEKISYITEISAGLTAQSGAKMQIEYRLDDDSLCGIHYLLHPLFHDARSSELFLD